jgi:hypothetical protein
MYEIFHMLTYRKIMKICKEIDCENKVLARGWCNMHYKRWWRYNNPSIIKNHGYSDHLLYGVWRNMKQRCYNKNCKSYKNYGGKNITVCNEWGNSFEVFIKWALPLWKKGLQIDRKNNNGNYEPSNCHFVTSKENNDNKELLMSTSTSGFRGVSSVNKKWRANIRIENKQKHLGYFDTPQEAALAYNNAIPDNRPKNPL